MQVQTRVDLVLTQSQLAIHPMLNSWPLELQYVPRIERHHPVINEGVYNLLFAHGSALAASLLVLRETVLDQAHARFPAQGFNPGHLLGKEILVAHLYLHSDRWLGQYSRRCHHWGVS